MLKNAHINSSKSCRILALLFAAVSFIGCGNNPQEQNAQPPTNADFLIATTSDAKIEKRYPGTIEGSVNVDIKAQVSGYLETIYVQEGEYVKKGQPLFKIKGDVFAEQVNNSNAAYKAALASLAASKVELEKIRPLVEGKVVSELQLKTAQAQYESASAQVMQAKSALGSSRINAAFAIIKAPVSGYIGRIPNRVGNLVTPSDTTPLTTLSEIENVFVYFSLSESDFISFQRDRKKDSGMNSVSLILADGSIYELKGAVEVASGNIDRNTGSIPLKAIFSNPDKVLRSGGSAKVVLTKSVHDVIAIPMASVKDIQDRHFVFALADSSKVAMKPIEIEARSGKNYIVKSGVAKGDKIATNSIDVLADGMAVIPNQATVSQPSVSK